VPEHSYKGPDVIRFLEQLPGYAPELNPDEGVWRYLKRVELRNMICADLEELTSQFWAAFRRLLDKPQVLRACVREVGYV
jgi:transposase